MTAIDVKAALVDTLLETLPGVQVRDVFAPGISRRSTGPVICVEILSEELGGSVDRAELGISIYDDRTEKLDELYEAVVGKLYALPCAVNSIKRGEVKYDSAVGTLKLTCRVSISVYEDGTRLRFGDLKLDGAMAELTMSHGGRVSSVIGMSGRTTVKYLGGGRSLRCRMTLSGDNAEEKYRTLDKLTGTTDTLFSFGCDPFTAVLTKLELTGPITPQRVSFLIEFEEKNDGVADA